MLNSLKSKLRDRLIAAQRYTQTDMVYLARGGFWLSSATVAGSLTAFLTALAFANLLPPETYGSYKYVLSLAGLLGAFTLSGLADAVSQAAAKGFDGALPAAFNRSHRWNALVTAAALAVAGYYFSQDNRTLGAALIVVAVTMPMTRSADLFSAFLKGKKAFTEATRWAIFRTVVPAAATVLALLLTDDAAVLVGVSMLSNAAAALFAYRKTVGKYRAAGGDGGAFAYGVHMSMINVMSATITYVDKILIFHYLGGTATAVYAFAQALPDQIDGLVTNSIRPLALPKFAGRPLGPGEIRPLFRKAGIILLALIPVVGAYVLAAPFLYRLFFPAYQASVPYSQLLALSLLATSPAQLFSAFLIAHRDIVGRYAIGPFTSLVWLALMFALVGPFGLYGLVAAKLITKAVGMTLSGVFSIRLALRPPSAGPASP
jgi:O-antigen/teichoic acid export membrane protein